MDPITVSVITGVASAVFAAGGAWGAAKAALNGTRERVRVIDTKVDNVGKKLDSHIKDTTDRLARIETTQDHQSSA